MMYKVSIASQKFATSTLMSAPLRVVTIECIEHDVTCLNERVFIKTMNHLLTNCSQSALLTMICRLMWCSAVVGITEIPNFPIEIPSGDVKCGKSHSEIRGFAKHIESWKVTSPDEEMPEAIGNLVSFFFYFLVVSLDICG